MDDDDDIHALPVPECNWPLVQSLWGGNRNMTTGRWASAGAGVVGKGAGIGAGVASHAALGSKIGLGVAATALTVGTAGIAIGVGAAVLQAGSMIASARSAGKTYDHMEKLAAIGARRHYQCTALGPSISTKVDHDYIHSCVIPYIINKKMAKLGKKVAGAAGLGILGSVFGVGKNLYKRAKGTLGRRRTYYAYVVARHTITHDCKLCAALVSELYDHEVYDRLKTMNSDDAGGWIARKMKST